MANLPLSKMDLSQLDPLLEAQEREKAHQSALAIATQLVGLAAQGLEHDAERLAQTFKDVYSKVNPFIVDEMGRLRKLAQENLTMGNVEAVPLQNPTLEQPVSK